VKLQTKNGSSTNTSNFLRPFFCTYCSYPYNCITVFVCLCLSFTLQALNSLKSHQSSNLPTLLLCLM